MRMFGYSRAGRTALAVLALGLLLAGCGRAAPRTGEQAASGDQAAADQGKTGQGKTMDIAGLKLVVPEDNVLWPTIYPKDPREPKYGGRLTWVNSGDPPSIDPSRTTSYLRSYINSSVYDRLLAWRVGPGADPYKIELVPALAESWDISNDGLAYTFKLRQGVKWANVPPVNGREFTSADVRFSFEYFTREESIIKDAFPNVAGLEAPDQYTVVYRLKQRDRAFLNTVAGPYAGYIVPREVVERDGDLRKVVIGTGPFYSSEGYQPKVGINYERNANHWRKDERGNQLPYTDGWSIRVVPDQTARIAAFRTGKLDIAQGTISTPPDMKLFLQTNPNIFAQEIQSAGVSVSAFRLDRDDLPFKDVRVRRALSLAINHDEMAQAIYGLPKATNLAPTLRGFWVGEKDDPQTLGEWFQYNPERAKQLLAEAGFANGFKTSYEFYVYGNYVTSQAEMYKNYWSKIGVEAELKSTDYTVYRANTDRGGWDDIIRTITFPTYDHVDNVLNFMYSKGLGNDSQGFAGDAEIDRWVEAVWASDSEAERLDLLKKIRRRWLDQVYTIPAVQAPSYTAWQVWVRNYQVSSNAWNGGYDHGIAHAWIDEGLRK